MRWIIKRLFRRQRNDVLSLRARLAELDAALKLPDFRPVSREHEHNADRPQV